AGVLGAVVATGNRAGRAQVAVENRARVVDRGGVVRVRRAEDLVATAEDDRAFVVREVCELGEAFLHDFGTANDPVTVRGFRHGDDRAVHAVLARGQTDRPGPCPAAHAGNGFTGCVGYGHTIFQHDPVAVRIQ